VRYFRANADTYRIDTCNIFTLGVSAGAFTALGVAYLNQESERMGACGLQTQYDAWFGNWICPDMGSIEGKGGNPGFSSSVRAVVNLSGGLFDLNWIDGPSDPPLLTFHGTADDVVGVATGRVSGNALHWTYVLRLPVDGKEYLVNFDDWMWQMDEHSMMNRSTMSKFGIDLGEVTLFFRKRTPGSPS
jgi:hypothetical protein